MPTIRLWGSAPITRPDRSGAHTTSGSAPIRVQGISPQEAGNAVFNTMIQAAKGMNRFSDDLESGRAFGSQFFCHGLRPDLNIDVSENYALPYGMNDKQFHHLIFESLPKIEEDRPDIYDNVLDRVLEDVKTCNPDIQRLPRDLLNMREKVRDILFGVASKYNLDDVKYFVQRRGSNMPNEVTDLHHQSRLECGYGEEKYLGFIPSDRTASRLIAAANNVGTMRYAAAEAAFYNNVGL